MAEHSANRAEVRRLTTGQEPVSQVGLWQAKVGTRPIDRGPIDRRLRRRRLNDGGPVRPSSYDGLNNLVQLGSAASHSSWLTSECPDPQNQVDALLQGIEHGGDNVSCLKENLTDKL